MLRDLQRELAAAFLPCQDDGPRVERLLGQLGAMPRLSPSDSLEIYRRSTANAFEEALAEILPVSLELVGEACFRSAARLYRRQRFSLHPDLARIGDDWPEFVPRQSFLDGVPYLADVGRLELALHHAYSSTSPGLGQEFSALADCVASEPGAWRFVLAPGFALLDSPYPVLAIWEAHRGGREVDHGWELDPGAGGERVIVWRRELEVCADRVEADFWPILCSIFRGESVAEQLVQMQEINSGDFRPILDTMEALLAEGWILAGVRIEEVPERPLAGDRR